MNTDYIFLNPAPMPYLTDCDYKKFEPNEYHISRIVDFFVLIFMLRGSLHFIEDDVSVSVQEGEWYIQRKNLLQSADRPSTDAEYYYFHFKADYTQDLLHRIKLPIRRTFSAPLLLPSLKKLCSLFHQAPQNPFDIQSEFLRLSNTLYEQESAYTFLTSSVMHFLTEHASESVTAQTLTEQFHYSAAYINRRLKAEIGVTAHTYLTITRLQKASRLLVLTERRSRKLHRTADTATHPCFTRHLPNITVKIRPSTGKDIASAIKMQLQDLCFYYIGFLFISKVQNQPYTLQN